jgi:hypothetical protein
MMHGKVTESVCLNPMAALLGVSPPIGGDNRNEKMERKKWRKKKENAKQK